MDNEIKYSVIQPHSLLVGQDRATTKVVFLYYPPIGGNTVHSNNIYKAETFYSYFHKHSNIDTGTACLLDPIRHAKKKSKNQDSKK